MQSDNTGLASIDDVRLLEFPSNGDERGKLVVAECGKEVPFDIKRVFYIFDSDADVIRGRHANKKTQFVLINVAGTSKVRVDDGRGGERVFNLDHPHMGLFLPRMLWKEMFDFSTDSVLLCLASEHYDPDEYIRDYREYVEQANGIAHA